MKLIMIPNLMIFAIMSSYAADENKISLAGALLNTNEPIPAGQEVVKMDIPSMVLSQETNFLRTGFFIGNVPSFGSTNLAIKIKNGLIVSHVSLAMLNTSSNKVSYWTPWPEKVESQFKIEMVDENGKTIPKTAYGRLFDGTSLNIPDGTRDERVQLLGLHRASIFPNWDSIYSLTGFDPQRDIPKCFSIEKSGQYKLVMTHHIYVEERRPDGIFLKSVTFSPVTVYVDFDAK